MNIGTRLRHLREQKGLTQGDIEEKTGLPRTYVSRLENGDSTPSLETVEKFARAFKVPMFHLLYDGEEPPKNPNLQERTSADKGLWGDCGKDARMLRKFRCLFSQMRERDLGILLRMAQIMSELSER